MAVANAVLDVIEKEDLKGNAIKVGNLLKQRLISLKDSYQIIGDVRGQGLFLGVEIVANRDTKEPATVLADYMVSRFKEEKILMSTEGKYGNVLKFKPPMVFSTENAERFVQIFDNILQEIYSEDYSSHLSSRSSASSYESINSLTECLSINSDEEQNYESSESSS